MPLAYLYVTLGIMTGAAFASQGAVNGRLAAGIGSTTLAALISFSVGWTLLLILNLILRPALPPGSSFSAMPWWVFLSGFIGALV